VLRRNAHARPMANKTKRLINRYRRDLGMQNPGWQAFAKCSASVRAGCESNLGLFLKEVFGLLNKVNDLIRLR
jgi:hypothetical protein